MPQYQRRLNLNDIVACPSKGVAHPRKDQGTMYRKKWNYIHRHWDAPNTLATLPRWVHYMHSREGPPMQHRIMYRVECKVQAITDQSHAPANLTIITLVKDTWTEWDTLSPDPSWAMPHFFQWCNRYHCNLCRGRATELAEGPQTVCGSPT